MSPQNPDKTSILKVYKTTFQSIKTNPILLAPFAIFALIEFIALVGIFLSPRMPLRLVFGPIIKTLWGENFLHYPYNFLLLPKLMALDRLFLSVIFSSLLTGVAVAIISGIYNKKVTKLGEAFKSTLKSYISLFCIILILTFVYLGLTKLTGSALVKYFMAGHTRLLFLGVRAWFGPILLVTNFALGILIQAAFVYAIPILIIEKVPLLKSIIRSFVLFGKLFIPTVILVTIPVLIYIPLIIIQDNSAILIDKLFPELVLLACVLVIIVNALIDLIITTSCTFLYLKNKEK
jgi:hypothetical protein